MRLAVAVALALTGVWAGCTRLLATDINPYKCNTDADCVQYPDAVCDNARRECIKRLPFANGGGEGDASTDGEAPDASGGACELLRQQDPAPPEQTGGGTASPDGGAIKRAAIAVVMMRLGLGTGPPGSG